MITKVLVTAGIIVAAGLGVAAPAFADPASFGDLGCACQEPVQQGLVPLFQDPVQQGFQQGFSDTNPAESQR